MGCLQYLMVIKGMVELQRYGGFVIYYIMQGMRCVVCGKNGYMYPNPFRSL